MNVKMSWVVALAILAGSYNSTRADDPGRVANINKAAAEIGAVQKKSGANGAFAAIAECYRRELAIAKALTRGLEACMAQDIIVSKVTADFYRRMGEKALQQTNSPSPETITTAMVQRVTGTTKRFNIPEQDAREFVRLVQQHGMDAYGKAMFPNEFPARTP